MGLTASQKCEDSSTNFRAILQKRKLEDAKMPNAKCRVVIRVSQNIPIILLPSPLSFVEGQVFF